MYKIYNYDEVIKLNIKLPDIYFTPGYGKVCEISDNGIWKCCIGENLIIPFIEKDIKVNNKLVKHLISPYGYGGIYSKNNININKFLKFMEKKYITHFLRFTPYFKNNSIKESYFKSKTFGINFKDKTYNQYLKKTKKNHKRSLKKSKDKLLFNLRNFKKNDINGSFQKIYKETMDRVNSNKYYYFNNLYYENLYKYCKNNVFIGEVFIKDTNEIIASAIIFHWNNKYLHYHLGGSKTKYLKLCPNNYLHDGVIQYGFKNNYELYHLGGGLINGDSLHKFKEQFSNISFDYYQSKLIYNNYKYELNCKLNGNNNNNYFPKYFNE